MTTLEKRLRDRRRWSLVYGAGVVVGIVLLVLAQRGAV